MNLLFTREPIKTNSGIINLFLSRREPNINGRMKKKKRKSFYRVNSPQYCTQGVLRKFTEEVRKKTVTNIVLSLKTSKPS